MTFNTIKSFPALGMILLAIGCGEAKAPEPMKLEQVPGTVESAFKDAAPEVKSTANEIVSAVQGKDAPKAMMDLQALFARPDLTPEQRDAAGKAILSVHENLRAAAAQGNVKAAEALEVYRASK